MSLRAGVSRVCITPPLGLPIGGTFISPNAEAIHDDLWVKCLILENNGSRFALVTFDLLGLKYDILDRIANEVHRRTEIKPDELIFNCTHNHSGPDTAGIISAPLQGHPYMDELVKLASDAVEKAFIALQPALAGYASTELSGVCKNRRIRVKDGKVRMNWEPIPEEEITGYGPIDPLLGVIRVDTAEGKPLAAVVHYTCHAAVVSPAPKQISADYPGYACRMIERLYGDGITAMFLNGAFGNINHIMKPAAFDAMAFGTAAERPFEEAERVGQMVAAKALELLPEVRTADYPIGSIHKSLDVELRTPPVKNTEDAFAAVSEQEARLAKALADQDDKEAAEAQISLTYAQHWATFFRKGETSSQVRLSAFCIGDLGVGCISGEPFVEIGFGIKKQSPFEATWVLGNTNGYSGYLPTEEAFAEGGYEIRTCGWSKWRVDADKKVVREVIALLKDLK